MNSQFFAFLSSLSNINFFFFKNISERRILFETAKKIKVREKCSNFNKSHKKYVFFFYFFGKN